MDTKVWGGLFIHLLSGLLRFDMSLAGFFDIGDASPNAQLGASSAKNPERSRLASFLLFSFSCFVF